MAKSKTNYPVADKRLLEVLAKQTGNEYTWCVNNGGVLVTPHRFTLPRTDGLPGTSFRQVKLVIPQG